MRHGISTGLLNIASRSCQLRSLPKARYAFGNVSRYSLLSPKLVFAHTSKRGPLPLADTLKTPARNIIRPQSRPAIKNRSRDVSRLSSGVALDPVSCARHKLQPDYVPPTSGFLSYLPRAVVPYAELSRLDKPAGTVYLFFPCAFSTILAAPLALPAAEPTQVLSTIALFFSGALIMRGAGCTINDLWDRDFDPQVARTRLRPIARGAIKPHAALIYTGAQLLAGLAVLLQFPTQCLWYGIPSLLLVATYPLAKRVTYYPQVVLGTAFSWGAMMGFPALGVDLLMDQSALAGAASLYASCVAWTVLYDMIYAHMDLKDDVKAGIKSIALAHETNTKSVLTGLAVVQTSLLISAGFATGAGPLFYAGSCGSAVISLGIMIWRVDLKSVQSCWWWFRYGCWLTGGGISTGLFADYLARRQTTKRLEGED